MTNPYATPQTEIGAINVAESNVDLVRTIDFGSVIRRWEWLRIFYNCISATVLLLFVFMVYPKHIPDLDFWFVVCVCGVAANLCYLAGPAVEGYGTHFKLWKPIYTNLLFTAGTFLYLIPMQT